MNLYMQEHAKRSSSGLFYLLKKIAFVFLQHGQMVFRCPEEQMNTDFM